MQNDFCVGQVVSVSTKAYKGLGRIITINSSSYSYYPVIIRLPSCSSYHVEFSEIHPVSDAESMAFCLVHSQ